MRQVAASRSGGCTGAPHLSCQRVSQIPRRGWGTGWSSLATEPSLCTPGAQVTNDFNKPRGAHCRRCCPPASPSPRCLPAVDKPGEPSARTGSTDAFKQK